MNSVIHYQTKPIYSSSVIAYIISRSFFHFYFPLSSLLSYSLLYSYILSSLFFFFFSFLLSSPISSTLFSLLSSSLLSYILSCPPLFSSLISSPFSSALLPSPLTSYLLFCLLSSLISSPLSSLLFSLLGCNILFPFILLNFTSSYLILQQLHLWDIQVSLIKSGNIPKKKLRNPSKAAHLEKPLFKLFKIPQSKIVKEYNNT